MLRRYETSGRWRIVDGDATLAHLVFDYSDGRARILCRADGDADSRRSGHRTTNCRTCLAIWNHRASEAPVDGRQPESDQCLCCHDRRRPLDTHEHLVHDLCLKAHHREDQPPHACRYSWALDAGTEPPSLRAIVARVHQVRVEGIELHLDVRHLSQVYDMSRLLNAGAVDLVRLSVIEAGAEIAVLSSLTRVERQGKAGLLSGCSAAVCDLPVSFEMRLPVMDGRHTYRMVLTRRVAH